MKIQIRRSASAVALAAAMVVATAGAAAAGDRKGDGVRAITISVANERGGNERLRAADFAVFRGEQKQQVLDVKPAAEVPANVAVVIQDGLDLGVGHELDRIKTFIRELPDGSQVMVGTLRGTHFRVTQHFTSDREAAADAIRLPILSAGSVASAPFSNLVEVLRKFDGVDGRNQIVLVSSGLELNRGLASASPAQNVELDRAIREAQRRGIPVWGIYANAAGALGRSTTAVTYGQGSLNRLAEETGGRAFFAGRGFVTFDHALAEVSRDLASQYLVEFQSAGSGDLEVDVEAPGAKVRHANK